MNFIRRANNCLDGNNSVSKPIYIINTFGYVNAFGPFAAKTRFKNSCFKISAYINIRLCNNISTPRMKSKPVTKAVLTARMMQAKTILAEMVAKILANRKWITGIGPYLIPGILIRWIFAKGIIQHHLSLGVNLSTCRKCMKCVDDCPTRSIKYTPGEGFKFLPTCTACMQCYNFCPSYSILMDGKYADPKIYFRYQGPK